MGARKRSKKVLKNKWYVVYEENLLSPVVVRYAFKEHTFAAVYAGENLMGKKIFIVSGQELLEYGITHLASSSKHSKIKPKRKSNDPQSKYYFPPELPKQRKKTLRTIYRRRYKRNLKKLINEKRGIRTTNPKTKEA